MDIYVPKAELDTHFDAFLAHRRTQKNVQLYAGLTSDVTKLARFALTFDPTINGCLQSSWMCKDSEYNHGETCELARGGVLLNPFLAQGQKKNKRMLRNVYTTLTTKSQWLADLDQFIGKVRTNVFMIEWYELGLKDWTSRSRKERAKFDKPEPMDRFKDFSISISDLEVDPWNVFVKQNEQSTTERSDGLLCLHY